MTYEHIPILICRKLLGTITPEEEAILTEWRCKNSSNAEAYERLMNLGHIDKELHRLKIADYHRPLADMHRRFEAEYGKRSHKLTLRFAAAAAVVLLFVSVTLLWWHSSGISSEKAEVANVTKEIKPGTTQAVLILENGETISLGADSMANRKMIAKATEGVEIAYSDIQTPRGGEFKVVLEDGTEVWLNADTKMRYPEHFTSDKRRVEIEGEAYFKVAHDSNRPFYVVSGGQVVRVYGTEFNVNAYSDEHSAYTTLVEGSISLKTIGGNGGELMLTPGHQVVYDKSTSSARVKTVDTDIVTSWRSGAFVFEDQTMEQIMRTLSRWYDFEYEFADELVASIVFMGSIPRYGSFKEVSDIFMKMGGIKLRQHGGKIIISAK